MKLQNDKKIHLLAGFIIAILIGYILGPITGFFAVALAGAGKEVCDYFNDGCPELADFIATVIGGAIGSLIMWILK